MAPGLAASYLESLDLYHCDIGNDGVASLILEGQVNTSMTSLNLGKNEIQGANGGRQVGFVLQHCPNLKELKLNDNHLSPLGASAMAPGLAASNLESLDLSHCGIGNDALMCLFLVGQVNTSLTSLILGDLFWGGGENDIKGAEGGQQVGLVLQHCPNLKELTLNGNNLGPLGAHAMGPGLAAAMHLERLYLRSCGIGNDGVASLIPEGQVNTSLIRLDLKWNGVQGFERGEDVVALAKRFINLRRLEVEEVLDDNVYDDVLNPDQQRRLDLLLDPKHRLCTEAQTLAGSTFPLLFRFMEERAHGHEHGLSTIFAILRNDGDDYFCNANNHANP